MFSPLILISIGIVLIALEVLTFSFILFWFGISSFLVGVLSYFINFTDGLYQIAAICVISILLLFTLRSKVMETFMKAKGKEYNDDFLNQAGTGVIKEGKVYFKATYWNIDSSENFIENEKVNVLSTKGSEAKISKIN